MSESLEPDPRRAVPVKKGRRRRTPETKRYVESGLTPVLAPGPFGIKIFQQIQVRPGNPVRAMLAQRLSDAAEILAKE